MTAHEQRLDGTQSDYFDAFAHERRRLAIDILSDATAPMALADLAAEIAAREANHSGPDPEHSKHVRTDLYHCHVPKLEAAGLLEFDCERRTVRLVEHRSQELVEITLD